MKCKIKDRCPCRSNWCEKPEPDYEKCSLLLVKAYERAIEEQERSEDKLVQAQDTINRIRRICDERG